MSAPANRMRFGRPPMRALKPGEQIITAPHGGRCTACGSGISPGTQIIVAPGHARHLDCPQAAAQRKKWNARLAKDGLAVDDRPARQARANRVTPKQRKRH